MGSVKLRLAYLLREPAAPDSIPSINVKRKKIVDVAEVNQRPCLEESVKWLENVQANPSGTG